MLSRTSGDQPRRSRYSLRRKKPQRMSYDPTSSTKWSMQTSYTWCRLWQHEKGHCVNNKYGVNYPLFMKCYGCDLTYSRNNFWYLNHGTDLRLCARCYDFLRRPRRFKTQQERNLWLADHNKNQVPPNKGLHPINDLNRICYSCGSSETYQDKTAQRTWALNKDDDGNILHVLCRKCDHRLIQGPIWNAKTSTTKISFKKKSIQLNYDPRLHICSKCNKTGLTHLHHTEYDPDNVLNHTIELCPTCHAYETWKSRKS